MASIVIAGDTSGSVTISAPAIAGTPTLTLPTTSGTLVVTGGAQTIEFAAGSAASPSITFTGDTNTGIFSPAADTIAFSEGGVESMRIDSSGNVGIGVTPNAWGSSWKSLSINTVGALAATTGVTRLYHNAFNNDSANVYRTTAAASMYSQDAGTHQWFYAGSGTAGTNISFTEAMRIDSSGNVGIGTSSPGAYSNQTTLAINGTTYGRVDLMNGGTVRGYLYGGSGGVTLETAGSLPVSFATAGTERMRINAGAPILCLSGGNTSATGTGIAFPATQSASSDANTLDDYEEGTWTPVIGGTGGQSGQSYSTQSGTYRKIGGFVYVRFDVTLSTKGTITSVVEIKGFPFTVSGSANLGNAGGSIVYWSATATSWNMIGGHCSDGSTSMVLYGATGSGNTTTTSLQSSDIGNTTRFMGFAVYPST